MRLLSICALALLAGATGLSAQAALPPGAARLMVTVASLKPGSPPVAPADFTIRHDSTEWRILGWQAVPPAVQLWIAIDEDTNADFNRRLDDLQKFITRLPSAFQVGVAYFSLASAQIAAPLSRNHKAVAAAVRPVKATPGVSPDPYASLQALLNQWPASPGTRREVLVLTDGSIHSGGNNNSHNPSIEHAIAQAQTDGIVVFGLSVDDAGNPLGIGVGGEVQEGLRVQGGGNTMNSPADTAGMADAEGEGNLRDVSDQTGGWWNVVTTPMTVLPSELAAVLECIQHQFYLVFQVPDGTPAGLAQLKIDIKAKGAKAVVPHAVYVAP